MGSRLIIVLALSSRVAAADPDSAQLLPDESRSELRARLEEDRARLLQEHQDLVERGRDVARREALTGLEREAYKGYREKREHRRHTGYKLIAVGGAFGIAAGVAGYLGSYENDQITGGKLMTKSDITDAADTGQIENVVGWSCLAVGGALAILGITDVVLNLDPGDIAVTPTVNRDGAGVGLMGHF